MLDFIRTEKNYTDLSRRRKLFLLILVSVGSSAIYTPIYLKSVFYDPLMQALNCTNEQLGNLVTIYAIAATVFYFFSGIVADKIRVRTLSWIGYLGTALLTLIYAILPSYNVLMIVFFCYAIFSILIWWGTRFKLVRLICSEEQYAQKIGVSYGIFGAAGLILGVVAIPIVTSFASAAMGVRTLLLVNFAIQVALAALAFFTIPKFDNEIGADMEQRFSFKGIW
ncbi:MAG: MFS transporter [Eggerthellaceae bacterium]